MRQLLTSIALAMLSRCIWLAVTLTIPSSTGCYIWLLARLHAAWFAGTFTIPGSTGCYIWLPARLHAAKTSLLEAFICTPAQPTVSLGSVHSFP